MNTYTGLGTVKASARSAQRISDRITATGIMVTARAGGLIHFTWEGKARSQGEAERDVRVRVHDLANLGTTTTVDLEVWASAR